jgi:hypothetical protein
MSLAICLADDAFHQRQLEFLFYFLEPVRQQKWKLGNLQLANVGSILRRFSSRGKSVNSSAERRIRSTSFEPTACPASLEK